MESPPLQGSRDELRVETLQGKACLALIGKVFVMEQLVGEGEHHDASKHIAASYKEAKTATLPPHRSQNTV